MKLTITNRARVADARAAEYVAVVLRGGDVSKTAGRDHPCHLTRFADGVLVWCRTTKAGNLSFTVIEDTP